MGSVFKSIGSVISSIVDPGKKQRQAQKKAQRQAQAHARRQADLADQENNRLNQKRANVRGALSAAEQAGRVGGGSTLLTGAMGIDPDELNLGKNNLLGQ